MATPFWLSHHSNDQLCRCVKIGRWNVCARCLGLYPTLIFLLVIEGIFRGPGLSTFDPWIVVLGTLPALFDWSVGQFRPTSGNNAFRIVSGVILAVALARSLWLHASSPLHPLAMAHFLWLLSAALLVFVAARLTHAHRTAKDADASPAPMPLTTEEILAGVSWDEVQRRYGLPHVARPSMENAAEANAESDENASRAAEPSQDSTSNAETP